MSSLLGFDRHEFGKELRGFRIHLTSARRAGTGGGGGSVSLVPKDALLTDHGSNSQAEAGGYFPELPDYDSGVRASRALARREPLRFG